MSTTPLKLGFIGLGIRGSPMCGHLIAAGHQLFVYARGVAERADIVFLMLPDTPDVEKVLFAEQGVAAGLSEIIVALNIEAVAEALVFAAKAGADPARVRQALLGGFAASRVLDVHGERMIKRTFAPGFRIELHQKDLNLALASARTLGVSLPNTATAQELFNSWDKRSDHSAMVTALERLASFELGAAPPTSA